MHIPYLRYVQRYCEQQAPKVGVCDALVEQMLTVVAHADCCYWLTHWLSDKVTPREPSAFKNKTKLTVWNLSSATI